MKIHVISMATFGGSAPSLWRSPGPDPALWPGMNCIMGQGKEDKKKRGKWWVNNGLYMVYIWFNGFLLWFFLWFYRDDSMGYWDING